MGSEMCIRDSFQAVENNSQVGFISGDDDISDFLNSL